VLAGVYVFLWFVLPIIKARDAAENARASTDRATRGGG
jgi:hypothetical protein